jgi:NADH dehydrogenase
MQSKKSEHEMTKQKKVLIVGGGFGGLYTALALDNRKFDSKTELYLVDPKERFVFLPLLYELAVGSASSSEVSPKYSDLLHNSKVKFIQGSVANVDFLNKSCTIMTQKNNSIDNNINVNAFSFDQIIIATGIQPRIDLIPGSKDHSLSFYKLEDAIALKSKLKSLKNSKKGFIRISVIGGGYSGVEVAANIAETIGKHKAVVTIIDRNSNIMSSSALHNREAAEKEFLKYYFYYISQVYAYSI